MKIVGTVSEIAVISQRGLAVFFVEPPVSISQVQTLIINVSRPNGTMVTFNASREFARKVDSSGNPSEIVALLVSNALPSDIPLGSVVSMVEPGT
jgi:hypothetical protein